MDNTFTLFDNLQDTPATSNRCFHVAIGPSDFLLPTLIQALQENAPGISLRCHLAKDDVQEQLCSGKLDLVIAATKSTTLPNLKWHNFYTGSQLPQSLYGQKAPFGSKADHITAEDLQNYPLAQVLSGINECVQQQKTNISSYLVTQEQGITYGYQYSFPSISSLLHSLPNSTMLALLNADMTIFIIHQ